MRIHLLIILFCLASIAAGSTALDTAKIDQITGLKGKIEREGRRLQSHLSSQRREGRRGRMDDAAVHGPRNVGGIHRRQKMERW